MGLIEEKFIKEKEASGKRGGTDLSKRHHVQRKLDIEKILDECKGVKKRIYIEGAAGTGKSTLSRFITNEWAKNKKSWQQFEWLFYIRLRDLNNERIAHQRTLLDALLDVIENKCFEFGFNSSDNEKRLLIDLLKNSASKIMLVLDGYDELSTHDYVHWLWEKIINSDYHLLITSRPGAYIQKSEMGINLNLSLLGFSDRQIERYVAHFFRYTNNANTKDVEQCLSLLKRDTNLWSLAHTPIHLEMLCSSWRQLNREPGSSLTHLYSVIVEQLLIRCRLAEGSQDIDRKQLESHYEKHLNYMECLAFLGMYSKQMVLNKAQIEAAYNIFPQNERDQPDFYKQLKALGLVKRYHQEQVEFAHPTFQEFFAARFMAKAIMAFSLGENTCIDKLEIKDLSILSFFKAKKWDEYYEMMWLFVAGLLAGQPTQHQSLELFYLKDGDNNLEEAIEIPKSHQCLQTLQTFFDLLLQEPRAKLEAFELPLLAGCLAEARMPKIMQLEGIKIHYEMWFKFYLYGATYTYLWDNYTFALRNQSKLKKLFDIVKGRKSLIKWVEPVILESIPIEYANLHERYERIKTAIEIMNDLGGLVSKEEAIRNEFLKQRVLLVFLRYARWDEKKQDVIEAVHELNNTMGSDIGNRLRTLLKHKNSDIRWVATSAIGAIGSEIDQALQGALLPLLKDENRVVRLEVLETIERIGLGAIKEIKNAILDLLKYSDSDETIVNAAIKAAVALGLTGELNETLLSLLKGKYTCRAAVEAVRQLGLEAREELKREVKHLLSAEDYRIRLSAIRTAVSLDLIKNKEMQEALSPLLDKISDWVDDFPPEALEELGLRTNEKLKQSVLGLLRYERDYCGSTCLSALKLGEALGLAESKELQDVLLPLLKYRDGDSRHREAKTIKELGIKGNEESRLEVIRLLKDKDHHVHLNAIQIAEALGLGKEKQVQEVILPLLQNPYSNKWLCAAAIKALDLGSGMSEELPDALLPLLDCSDVEVYEPAIAALVKTQTGLITVCNTLFSNRPSHIPPSCILDSSKHTTKVNDRGELECLKLCGTVLQNVINDSGRHNLTENYWTLAIVRRKSDAKTTSHSNGFFSSNSWKKLKSHAFLIIEGVHGGVRFASRVDFCSDSSSSKSSGQKVTINITPIEDFHRFEELSRDTYCMVHGISREKGEELFKKIERDQNKAEQREIVYSLSGDGSSASKGKSKHSCISWCLGIWQEIGLPLKRKWYDSFVVIPQAYLHEPDRCSIM